MSTENNAPSGTDARKASHFGRYVLWLLIPIPGILGMIGLTSEGSGFWNAAYSCLSMYLVDYGDPTGNIWIQAARWLAPLATAGSLTLFFASLSKCARRFYARCNKNSVAVFGAEPDKSELLKQLGANGIAMDATPVRAGSYILVGSENDNLEFYQQHADAFRKKDVYLKCQSLPEQASCDPRLHLFSPEETAVQLFWKENCPYALSKAAGHQLKIAIFGFGRLGEELIVQGLQRNIFSPDQIIEYHVFGSDNGFKDTYTQLSEISDPVIFHTEPWYKAKDLLQECQMRIVVQQDAQLELLRGLTMVLPQETIYVFSAQPSGVAMLAENSGVIGYDWKAKSMLAESIRGTRIHYLAKRLNLRYAHLYNGIPEDEAHLESEWAKLTPFTRYSNISSANYCDVWLRILDGNTLTDDRLRLLGELEHIRWCRYHFLNNWKYGIPENGKVKDPLQRVHKLLVPNNELDEAEQDKDRENIRILMELHK